MSLINRVAGKKPKAKAAVQVPKGFKKVAPPKNAERRRRMEGEDITVSGGHRSAQPQHT